MNRAAPAIAGTKRPRSTLTGSGNSVPARNKKKKTPPYQYSAKGVQSSFTLRGGRWDKAEVQLICRKYQELPSTKIKQTLIDTIKATNFNNRFSFSRSGHFGRVVAAKTTDPKLSKRFVVKYNIREKNADAFLDEGQLQFRLKHPAVLECPGYASILGRSFLILPRLKRSLTDAFTAGLSDNPEERLRMSRETAEGLNYLHSLGLVHRDVSPNNVLLDRDKHCYIADFGSVIAIGRNNPARNIQPDDTTTVFRGKKICGKPLAGDLYSAPEQIFGDKVKVRWDIYGWGLILYSLLYGEFIWYSWTNHQRCKMHLCTAPSCKHILQRDNPQNPLRSFTSLPEMHKIDASLQLPSHQQKRQLEKFQELAETCLSLEPKDRPQSISQTLQKFHRLEEKFDELSA